MRPDPTAADKRFRARLVRRAVETDAPLLAPALHRYAAAEGMDWAALARTLGCTEDALNAVALCRPPRAERFVADVQAIAEDTVDPDRLLPLLRRIQVLSAFAESLRVAESSAPYATGDDRMLLAARDRDDAESETDVVPSEGAPSSAEAHDE